MTPTHDPSARRLTGSDASSPRGIVAGLGRADITAYDEGSSLFGYGVPGNVARGVAMPLHARALVVGEGAARVAYVCLELGFVSESVRQAIVARLAEAVPGLDDDTVMVTATHTHSGPGGFSKFLFYAMATPGFSPRVHDAIVDGATRAVREAVARLKPARLWQHRGEVPLAEPVAFNRAWEAFSSNRDVARVRADRRDEAVDRSMTLLRVDDLDDRALGLVSWFATHGTSVKSEGVLLHPDNKGVAAAACETRARDELDAPDFVAIFAQGAAGDVSPNFRWSDARRKMLGAHDDDLRSAEAAGAIQARHAWRLFLEAPRVGRRLTGPVRGSTRRADFGSAAVDPRFADDLTGVTTAPGRLGLGFAEGTTDGPGPLFRAPALREALVRARQWRLRGAASHADRMHGAKVALVDVGAGERGLALGMFPVTHPWVGRLPDARARYFYAAVVGGREAGRAWVPHALPTQVLRVGSLAVVGVPFEATTVAGRRLRAVALGSLSRAGVAEVVVNGYANAYASYLTTPEEYDHQGYEGASTLFGRWTLGAVQTGLRALCESPTLTALPSGRARGQELDCFEQP